MSFQGDQFRGVNEIMAKYAKLPFGTTAHEVSNMDCQVGPSNVIIVMVAGSIRAEGEEHPLPYSEVFTLAQDPAGNWFITNDIFRLTLC
jgi:hypothetical protein